MKEKRKNEKMTTKEKNNEQMSGQTRKTYGREQRKDQ